MRLSKLMHARRWQRSQGHIGPEPHEGGQSLVEMAVGMISLILVVLALFEMSMVFRAYIVLLNASREGAFYAAFHPTMSEGDPEYNEYVSITRAEVEAAGLDLDSFTIEPPETPEGAAPQRPIRVVVRYQLVNPTQGIVLPWLGRMGLLSSFPISAATTMPIRLGAE